MVTVWSEPFTYSSGALAGKGLWQAVTGMSGLTVSGNKALFGTAAAGTANLVQFGTEFGPGDPWTLAFSLRYENFDDVTASGTVSLARVSAAFIFNPVNADFGLGDGANDRVGRLVLTTPEGLVAEASNVAFASQTDVSVSLAYDGSNVTLATGGTTRLTLPCPTPPTDRRLVLSGLVTGPSDALKVDSMTLTGPVRDMAGSVGTSSAAATVVYLDARTIGMTVTGDGHFRYAINDEAANATTNACLPADGSLVPLRAIGNITRVTIYANNGETNQTYTLANLSR